MPDSKFDAGLTSQASYSQGLPAHLLAAVSADRRELAEMPSEPVSAFFDAYPAPVAVLDDTGKILALNAAWQRLVSTSGQPCGGVGTSYVMDCQSDDAMLGPEVPRAIAGVRSVLEKTRETFTLEYPCHVGDRNAHYIMRVGRHRVGQREFLVVVHDDITSRHQAEIALHSVQSHFESLLTASRAAIWQWDLQANTVYYSPGYESLLGYATGDLSPDFESFKLQVHPDDRRAIFTTLFERLDDVGTCACKCRLRTRAGGYLPVRMHAAAICDAGGTPVRIAGSLYPTHDASPDVSSPQLRLYQRLVDTTRQACVVTNIDGHVLLWNRGAEELLGPTADEARGQPLEKMLGETTWSWCEPHWKRAAGGTPSGPVDGTCRPRGRDAIEVSVDIAPLTEPQSPPEAVVMWWADRSEREQWRQRVRERDRQLQYQQKLLTLGDVAGTLAHEFNNLLQAIQGFVLLAMDGLEPTDRRAEDLKLVLSATDRAAAFSRQLLGFSRRDDHRRVRVDLNQLVTDLAQWLRPLLGELIDFELQLQPGLEPIIGDSGALQQVLTNLCINARDAMPRGGRVTLETRRVRLTGTEAAPRQVAPGWFACLTVRDTGKGIPEELREKIFEPFFTTKPAGRGTGLGLPLVREILQEHRGFVSCESGPDRGTAMQLYFPLAPIGESRSAVTAELPDGERSALTVLVADDDTTLRQLAQRTLEKAGYEVLLAADGGEVIQMFQREQHRVDVVLLDVVMPDKSGQEVYQSLRALRHDIPVVLWTGYHPELGYADFADQHNLIVLQKPFDAVTLLHAIQAAYREGSSRVN